MAIAFQWGQGISILQYKKLYILTLTPKLPLCCHDVCLFYSRDLKEQHRVRWALVNNLLQQWTSPIGLLQDMRLAWEQAWSAITGRQRSGFNASHSHPVPRQCSVLPHECPRNRHISFVLAASREHVRELSQ